MSIACITSQVTTRQLLDNAETALITIDNLKSFIATANPYDIGHQDYNELHNQYSIAVYEVQLLEIRQNDLLSVLELESMNPAPTLTDYKNAIALFEVKLSVADGFQCVDKWETPESGLRIKEVYRAIRKTALAIGREMAVLNNVTLDNDYKLFGIFRFLDAFGGLELQITNGTTYDENNDPILPVGYALTQNANLILLWNDALLKLEDETRGYPLHTAPNLVHEFGHVLDLRTGDVMATEWGIMRNLFGELVYCGKDVNDNDIEIGSITLGFNIDEGWEDFNKRENKFDFEDFHDPDDPNKCLLPTDEIVCAGDSRKDTLCAEMELERIADMFLFWIYSDDDDYKFDITDALKDTIFWKRKENIDSLTLANKLSQYSSLAYDDPDFEVDDLNRYINFLDGTWKSGAISVGTTYLVNRFTEEGLADIDTGDYMFVNLGDQTSNHGFLIVGWGDVDEPAVGLNTKVGRNGFTVKKQANKIPYVADFAYGYNGTDTGFLQDIRPRPFYSVILPIQAASIASQIDKLENGDFAFDNDISKYNARLRGNQWLPFSYLDTQGILNYPNIQFFKFTDSSDILHSRFKNLFQLQFPC